VRQLTLFLVDHIEMEKSHPSALHLGFRAKNNKQFPARILTVEKSELRSWDLCAFFSDRKVSSKEKKSKDKERPIVKTLECTHLELDFEDDKAKEEFEIELWEVRTRRQKQLNDAGDARRVAERAAQSPTLALHSEGNTLRRGSFLNARLTNASVAPKLPPIERLSTIRMESASVFSERPYICKHKLG
jgi:hypothetical protein